MLKKMHTKRLFAILLTVAMIAGGIPFSSFSQLFSLQVNAAYSFDEVQLYGSGSDNGKIVITIVGDGYTASEQGTFLQSAQRISDSISNCYPFTLFRDKLSIHAVKVISNQSGTGMSAPYDTFFQVYRSVGSAYIYPSAEGIRRKNELIQQYAPQTAATVVMANKPQGGDCTVYGDDTVCVTYAGFATHELIHSIGKLNDEYNGAPAREASNMSRNVTTATARWKNFIGINGVTVTPYSNPATWYHPGSSCMMGNGRTLCPVCAASFTEALADITGTPFYGTLRNGVSAIGTFQPEPLNTQTTISYPSGHGKILDYAFHGCDRLQNLTIPADVTSIGQYAFLKCTGLRTIHNLSAVPQNINGIVDPFYGVTRSNITLNVPAGTRNAYLNAGWTGFNIVENGIAPVTHTVQFNTQGGSYVAPITNAIGGNTITAPVNPTKSGYTFGGWYRDSACTNPWIFTTDTVTSNITLYAQWTQNQSTKTDISNASLVLSKNTWDYTSGDANRPQVLSVSGVNISPSDYTVEYAYNLKTGTGTVSVIASPSSDFIGTATASFAITNIPISTNTFPISIKAQMVDPGFSYGTWMKDNLSTAMAPCTWNGNSTSAMPSLYSGTMNIESAGTYYFVLAGIARWSYDGTCKAIRVDVDADGNVTVQGYNFFGPDLGSTSSEGKISYDPNNPSTLVVSWGGIPSGNIEGTP